MDKVSPETGVHNASLLPNNGDTTMTSKCVSFTNSLDLENAFTNLLKTGQTTKNVNNASPNEEKELSNHTSQSEKYQLRIASVNIRSVIGNSEYLSELAFKTNIVFFCEGFNDSEQSIHDNVLLFGKKLFCDPATRKPSNMDENQLQTTDDLAKLKRRKKGRLSNGSGFIVDETISCDYVIHNSRISYIQINKLVIIGCYLPYQGGTTQEIRTQNENEFIQSLSDLSTLVETLEDGILEFVIVGDFNTDFKKHKNRSELLADFCSKHSLTSSDINKSQAVSYTYFKIVEGNLHLSWIDHVMVNELMLNVENCVIETSINNMGDHNSIITDYVLNYDSNLNQVITKKKRKKKKRKIWNDTNMKDEYATRSQNEIIKLSDLKHEIQESTTDIEPLLSEGIKEFGAALKRAEQKSQNVIRNNAKLNSKNNNSKTGNKYKKSKIWWDESCFILFKLMIASFKHYCENGFSPKDYDNFKKSRSEFKNHKKFLQKLRRNKSLRELNDLFKLDRESFWRRLKQMSRSKKKILVKIDKLKTIFEKTFNERNEINKAEEEANRIIVDKFIKEQENKIFDVKLNHDDIHECIKSLKNGKSIGYHGISNENLKYALCDELVDFILVIFTKMINYKVIPQDFNISILKPLVKDLTKSSADPTNLRPVAISNVLANLFEAILLKQVNLEHIDSDKQFGFKSDSSCNHAGFVLQEAINLAKQNGKKLYVVAIDASKAFDKVHRLALWSKMINVNTKKTWMNNKENLLMTMNNRLRCFSFFNLYLCYFLFFYINF